MRNSNKGRFRVWDRSQDSFNGEDLVYNFDTLDVLLGGPDGTPGASGQEYKGTPSTWLGYSDVIVSSSATKYPGNTNSGFEKQSGRRTLYSVISGLNYNDVPLGTIIQWWRPVSTITLPDGWLPCDGRTITSDQHSYSTGGSITLPDMRNKMTVGADLNTKGINALNGYKLEENATPAQDINNNWTGVQIVSTGGQGPGPTGAPGVGYDSGLETTEPRSGSNLPRNLSHNHNAGTLAIKDHVHLIPHTHSINDHLHSIAAHSHTHDHVHLMPNHIHEQPANVRTGQAQFGDGSEGKVSVRTGTSKDYVYPAHKDHVHNISWPAAGTRRAPDNNDGLFLGSSNLIWGTGGLYTDGRNMRSNVGGYTPTSVTSRPTSYKDISYCVFNAHDLNTNTSSVELTTKPIGAITTVSQSIAKSGVITGTTPAEIISSKGLLGSTEVYNNYVNIRPQYVGLLYLVKVKVSTNII